MVLLGHMVTFMGWIDMPLTPALGSPVADIFLFLSALGLMSSYTAKGLKDFGKRRLAVVLIPFIFRCAKSGSITAG